MQALIFAYLSRFRITKESSYYHPLDFLLFVALQGPCLRMNGAWSLSTRGEVIGLSWQTGWLPVFFGLGLPIYCCVRSSSCGRFSMPSSVTQKWVVRMHIWILCSFFVLLVPQTTVCCVCRWSNGSLVPWEQDAGLFMVDVTCVTSMSWTMSSCHASAKATRSLYKYFVSDVACPLVTVNLQNAALLEPICRWQCRTWPNGIMGVYKCHVLNTCTDIWRVEFIIKCVFFLLPLLLFQAASKYMNCFLSPLLTVVAKNVAFFAGSLLAVLIALTIYDEDVLAVEHVLSSITLLGVCITVCRYTIVSLVIFNPALSCPDTKGQTNKYKTWIEETTIYFFSSPSLLQVIYSW